FSEAMRHELEMSGSRIRISVVYPGGVKTQIARSARLGANAEPSCIQTELRRFEKIARTMPEKAAERIMQGVLRDQFRILIGMDAYGIERIQRWLPESYWTIIKP